MSPFFLMKHSADSLQAVEQFVNRRLHGAAMPPLTTDFHDLFKETLRRFNIQEAAHRRARANADFGVARRPKTAPKPSVVPPSRRYLGPKTAAGRAAHRYRYPMVQNISSTTVRHGAARSSQSTRTIPVPKPAATLGTAPPHAAERDVAQSEATTSSAAHVSLGQVDVPSRKRPRPSWDDDHDSE